MSGSAPSKTLRALLRHLQKHAPSSATPTGSQSFLKSLYRAPSSVPSQPSTRYVVRNWNDASKATRSHWHATEAARCKKTSSWIVRRLECFCDPKRDDSCSLPPPLAPGTGCWHNGAGTCHNKLLSCVPIKPPSQPSSPALQRAWPRLAASTRQQLKKRQSLASYW